MMPVWYQRFLLYSCLVLGYGFRIWAVLIALSWVIAILAGTHIALAALGFVGLLGFYVFGHLLSRWSRSALKSAGEISN